MRKFPLFAGLFFLSQTGLATGPSLGTVLVKSYPAQKPGEATASCNLTTAIRQFVFSTKTKSQSFQTSSTVKMSFASFQELYEKAAALRLVTHAVSFGSEHFTERNVRIMAHLDQKTPVLVYERKGNVVTELDGALTAEVRKLLDENCGMYSEFSTMPQ